MSEDSKSANGTGNSTGRAVRSSVLDYMRKSSNSAAPDRFDRSTRRAAVSRSLRATPAFEDLPEYKQVVAQRSAGEQLGMGNPFYRAHEGSAGATTRIDGQNLINFASYDYLGLNRHPKVMEAAKAAIDRYAISASASRLVGGERPIHTQLEQQIARIYDVEAAVTFVSGYLTNVAVIGALLGPNDLVIHDELIHNSAVSGIRLSGATRRFFKHNDLKNLEELLMATAGEYRRTMVIVEGVYSMDGDIADLPGLVKLKHDYGFWLMVDEAHSLGVLGQRGFGTMEHFGIAPEDVDIRMGTLSKTTSSCGGYVAGTSALIDVLKASAGGFVYSVGLAPVLAAAASASLEALCDEPERVEKLKRNGQYFVGAATRAGLDTGLSVGYSVVPIMVGDSVRAARLSNDLIADGVNVLPIIHPAVPEGQARLRFFITSDHTFEQLDHSIAVTERRLRELEAANFGVSSVDFAALSKFL
jgi:8-amino-7-oxononanoate synthase